MERQQGVLTASGETLGDPEPRFVRLIAVTQRVPPDGWALLGIAGAIVLANLPYLLDLFDPNPLGPRSGLLTATTPGVLRGLPTIDPNNGFISQAVSHRAALGWLHLHVPWWNPYEGTGAPLAGNMQSAALFPPTLLTLLPNGQLYEHMLLEMVAGFSTYLLLRRIAVNRWASAAAAIAFAVNGTFAWFAHSTVNPIAFLPLLLLGIELAYAASVTGRRGGWWVIAVAGALSVYAGFPELAYIDTLMATGWFAWRCCCLRREHLRTFVGKAAAATAVGTLLAAPLLISSIDYFNHADLWLHTGGYFGKVHLPTQALPQLVLPDVYGPILGYADPKLILFAIWENVGGFFSTSLLLFGLLGLLSRRRRGLRLWLVIWIVLAVARIYDSPHLLGDVLGVIPGMSNAAFYRYAFPSVELSVVILAALGMDYLATAPAARRRLLWAGLASLATVGLAAIAARPLANQLGSVFRDRPYYAGAVVWGAGIIVAGVAAALLRNSRARTLLVALLVAGDALLLFAIPELSAPRTVQTDLAPVTFLQRRLGPSRFFTLGPLAPNYGSYFGVASLNAVDVPVPSAFATYVKSRLDQAVDPVSFVGLNAGGRPLGAPSPQQELLKNLAGYRAAAVAYILVPVGQVLPQSPATFQLVFRSPTTWIYHLSGSASYFTAASPRCRLRTRSRESVQVTCPVPTTLTRRETDLPGWGAEVDGRAVAVRKADGPFQAITVGPGTHRVTFGYLPPNVDWGLAAFAVGCGWLVMGVVGLRRRRRSVESRESSIG